MQATMVSKYQTKSFSKKGRKVVPSLRFVAKKLKDKELFPGKIVRANAFLNSLESVPF